MSPGLWIASGLGAIWLLWFAGARHTLCPPIAFIFSVAIAIVLFSYVGVSSGAYTAGERRNITISGVQPAVSPDPVPKEKPSRKKKRTHAAKKVATQKSIAQKS